MVKDQSLFSYVAPGNIFAWVLMPLRYCIPLRHFVWLNRTIIKITHFPLLLIIYLYEKHVLAPAMYEPTDFVDNPGMGRAKSMSINPVGRPSLFSPTIRIREESVAGFQQDRALEEVFRRTPDYASLRTQRKNERRKAQNAIRNWMDQNDAIPESPNHHATIDSRTQQEWARKLSLGRDGPPRRRHVSEARSVASDPADLVSNSGFMEARNGYFDEAARRDQTDNTILKDQDADDELVTNDEDEDEATVPSRHSNTRSVTDEGEETEDYFKTPTATRFNDHIIPTSLDNSHRPPIRQQQSHTAKRAGLHNRTLSTNTILYNPADLGYRLPTDDGTSPGGAPSRSRPRHISNRPTPVESPMQRSPRRTTFLESARARPGMPSRDTMHTTTSIHRVGNGLIIDANGPRRGKPRRMSSSDLADIQSDLAGVADHDAFNGVPSSFATQMAMATGMIPSGGQRANEQAQRERDNDRDRMSRLVLARMKTLEEGFADVVKEMRGFQRSSAIASTAHNSASEGTESFSWHGEGEETMQVLTNIYNRREAIAGKAPKAGSSGKTSGSRPASRRSTDKSNRNSVILRSPLSSQGGGRKGKGKQVEVQREEERHDDNGNDDSDELSFGRGARRTNFTRRGSSV